MIMNTTIRKFTYFLTACLLGCLTGHGYEQDNWYLAWEVSVDTTNGVAYWENNSTGVGQIYVANGSGNNGKVSVYDLNGSLDRHITIASTRNSPNDLCLDNDGNIYICEYSSVTCLGNDGTFQWRKGKSVSISLNGYAGSGNGEFNIASGITIGTDNNLYVVDRRNHRIQVLGKNGTFIRSFGENGTAPGLFNEPLDITVLRNGNIVVSDVDKLHLFDSNRTFLKRTAEIDPHFVSSSESGLIFAYDRNRGDIKTSVFTSEMEFLSITGMYPVHHRPRTAFTSDGDIISSIGGKLSLWKRAYRTKGLPQRNVIPQPAIRKVSQRSGTNVLDLDFEIIDSDDSNATVGIIAYCGNDKVVPSTWVDGTGSKIGTPIATNQLHRVSWDVKQDWNTSTGTIKFEILCQDGRTDKPVDIHFLTLPLADGNLTISRSPILDADMANYFRYLVAIGSNEVVMNSEGGISKANGDLILRSDGQINSNSKVFFMNKLGYRWATTTEIANAKDAATPGTINSWTPSNQIKPRNLPQKVNEYGFDTGTHARQFWVVKE